MRYALNNCDRVVSADGQSVKLEGESTAGRPFSITVKLSDINRYLNGELIQNAFPYLSADERELCMTGYDTTTWNEMFSGSGEDEYNEY
jgi:hypothetical protein